MHYDLSQNEEMLIAIARNDRTGEKKRFRAAVELVRLWMLKGKIHEENFNIYHWDVECASTGDTASCGCIGHWAEFISRKRFSQIKKGCNGWAREQQLCFGGLQSKANVPNAIAAIEDYLRG